MVRDTKNSRIVGGIEPDEQVRVSDVRQCSQNLRELG
ncbi:MAG: hypothetical protein AKCLJLPJ_00474 [Fimbriimonadales bacterium]|nr:hypothetical protein [Fimbriimonadales bacterium]